MPVHAAVSPDLLAAALTSIFNQTRAPDEVVVVVDGPVSAQHEEVLGAHAQIRRLDIPECGGAGAALALGLAVCHCTFVARADSDDVNEPTRLEFQMDLLLRSGADVCSAAMTEVKGDPPRAIGVRGTPLDHASVARRMRLSNPVNHPTVVFRRTLALSAGGYQVLPFLEDYDLWARMLVQGANFVGTAEPLVRFRTDGMQDRRTLRIINGSEQELQHRMHQLGIISRRQMYLNMVLRSIYRHLPRPILDRVYAIMFRRGL